MDCRFVLVHLLVLTLSPLGSCLNEQLRVQNDLLVERSSSPKGPFPFGASVFPLLTTGWYYKPGPTEALVLGLLLVKVLSLRLGATMAGVPYHLNDIFDHFSSSRSLHSGKAGRGEGTKTKREIDPNKQRSNFDKQLVDLSPDELKILRRILLALRRIDSHDCFIRYICQSDRNPRGENSYPLISWISILRRIGEEGEKGGRHDSVWSLYKDALDLPPPACASKYSACPLTNVDMSSEGILSGLF